MDNLSTKKQADAANQDLSSAILAYLGERSQAMDSVEGIAEWWLLRQRVRSVTQQVEKVVQELASRGIVETVEHGGTTLYRLRRPDFDESAALADNKN